MLHIKDKILNHLKTIKPSLQQNGMEKIGIFDEDSNSPYKNNIIKDSIYV
jgi:hypothetical protein